MINGFLGDIETYNNKRRVSPNPLARPHESTAGVDVKPVLTTGR
jgi:hypothetical protein